MSGALADLRVLLGVCGGIAAYKAPALARLFVTAGAEVDAVLTAGAESFVGRATFEGITGRATRSGVFEDVAGGTHVAVGQAADIAVIYPATAHVVAKLAAGLADDLLTTTLLASTAPLVVAPAMHTEMWQHPATQANVATLRGRGVLVVGPADGPLMGGDRGAGRLVEPAEAFDAVQESLARGPGRASASRDLAGTTVVVTAGGTREAIDPVRFLGNRSSGRMGFALAAAAARRGARVRLVTAPAALPTPTGVERIDVTTAREMHAAVLAELPRADVVIKAAAVADFRPVDTAATKLKKQAGVPTLALTANPDILAELGRARGDARRPVLVGFAAETDDVEANGRAKLTAKGADLLVVNDVSQSDAGFDVDANRVVILGRDGARREIPLSPKAVVADRVLDEIVALL